MSCSCWAGRARARRLCGSCGRALMIGSESVLAPVCGLPEFAFAPVCGPGNSANFWPRGWPSHGLSLCPFLTCVARSAASTTRSRTRPPRRTTSEHMLPDEYVCGSGGSLPPRGGSLPQRGVGTHVCYRRSTRKEPTLSLIVSARVDDLLRVCSQPSAPNPQLPTLRSHP